MKTIYFFFFLSLSLSITAHAQENYLARFRTLNSNVNGIMAGSSTIYFSHDRVKAFVRLFAGGPKVWHMQNVYTGDRCPGMQDDLNLDGFIDIQEAQKVVGPIIFPMDGDLSSQREGGSTFPMANVSGSYTYDKEAKLRHFIEDLRDYDENPRDNIIKLAPYESLRVEGRVVIIQGVSKDMVLPPTVATYGNRKTFQTLPVACGVFKRTW